MCFYARIKTLKSTLENVSAQRAADSRARKKNKNRRDNKPTNQQKKNTRRNMTTVAAANADGRATGATR